MTLTKRALIFVFAFLVGLADAFPFVVFMNTPDIFNSVIFILTSALILGYFWQSHGAIGGFFLAAVVFAGVHSILILAAYKTSGGGLYLPEIKHTWNLFLMLIMGPVFGWIGELLYRKKICREHPHI